MTARSVRAMLIALAVAGLAGCIDARSQYAPYAGYQPPSPNQPLRPQYPITQDAAAASPAPRDAAPADSDADGAGPRAAPTQGVGAQALPPVGDAPATRAPMVYEDDGRPLVLTPLVWSPDAEPVERIDIARRHRRLRPEIDAMPDRRLAGRHERARRGRGRRGHEQAAAAEDTAAKTVVVRRGDTINAIARRLGTTPKAIMEANASANPRRLHLGETLVAPGAEAAKPEEAAPEESPKAERRGRHGRERATRHEAESDHQAREAQAPKAYDVKHGDTLYSIGRRYGVTVQQLRDMNDLTARSRLHAGQKLDLPGQEAQAAPEEERPARATRRERLAPTRRSAAPSSVAESAFGAPGAQPRTPVAPAPLAPTGPTGPSQPVPYTSLPGHVSPPASPPAYSPPAYSPPRFAPQAPVASAPGEAPSGPTDAQVIAAGRGLFIWPTRGTLLSGFGPKPGGQRSDGLDIAAADGAPVHAAAAGDVVYAGNLVPGFGNLVLLKHEDGWVTAYAHLSTTEVKIKEHVAQGAEIGTVGSSGGVDQPQLHFEIRYAASPAERARPIDPALVLPVGQ